jgi:hypothetical protein
MSSRVTAGLVVGFVLAAGAVGAQVTVTAIAQTQIAGPLGPGLGPDAEFFDFANLPGAVLGGDGVATFMGRGDITPNVLDDMGFASVFRRGISGGPSSVFALASPSAPVAPGFGLPFFRSTYTLFFQTMVTGPGGVTSAWLPVNSFSPTGVFTDAGGSLSLVAGEGLTVMPGLEPGALLRRVLSGFGGSVSGVKVNATGRTVFHGAASVEQFVNERQGLWATQPGGGLVALAVQDGVVPLPSSPTFTGFGSFAWSGNDRAVFSAFTTEGEVVCTSVEGAVTVLMTDDDNPIGEFNARFTGVRQNDDGDITVDLSGSFTSAILVDRTGTGTSFTQVARTLSPNPFLPMGTFASPLGASVLGGGGHVAFIAESGLPNFTRVSGVYRSDPDGQLRAIVVGAQPAPGFPNGSRFAVGGREGPGLFSDLAVNALGQVLFRAMVEKAGPNGVENRLAWYVANPLPSGDSELVLVLSEGEEAAFPGLSPGFTPTRLALANVTSSSGDEDGGQVCFVALPREAPTFGRAIFQAIIDNNDDFEPEAVSAILLADVPAPPIDPPCVADTNGDGTLSPADFSAWIAAFNAQAPACDQNGDGQCLPNDFASWIQNFNAGCN